jgi:uncharacterized membrane protein
VAVLFALIAAVAYGVSDFVAGLMARRASVFMVTLIAEGSATVLLFAAVPFTGGAVDGRSLLWGTVAGLGGAGGAMFLYRGLARGSMSIVGPVSAVVTAAGSAVVGVALGERPGAVIAGGVVLACIAVALVSMSEPTERVPPGEAWRALLNAAVAGFGFMVLFVGLNRAGAGAGLRPVAVATLVGLLLALVAVGIALVRRHEDVGSILRVLPGGVVTGLHAASRTLLLGDGPDHVCTGYCDRRPDCLHPSPGLLCGWRCLRSGHRHPGRGSPLRWPQRGWRSGSPTSSPDRSVRPSRTGWELLGASAG